MPIVSPDPGIGEQFLQCTECQEDMSQFSNASYIQNSSLIAVSAFYVWNYKLFLSILCHLTCWTLWLLLMVLVVQGLICQSSFTCRYINLLKMLLRVSIYQDYLPGCACATYSCKTDSSFWHPWECKYLAITLKTKLSFWSFYASSLDR